MTQKQNYSQFPRRKRQQSSTAAYRRLFALGEMWNQPVHSVEKANAKISIFSKAFFRVNNAENGYYLKILPAKNRRKKNNLKDGS